MYGNLNWNDDLWVVHSVDSVRNIVVMYNRFDDETATLSIADAEASIMH